MTNDQTYSVSGIRLADLIAALSVATDLGMGQPLEFALRSCVLAMRLGGELGMSDEALREVYYEALLRYVGCNVDTHLLASLMGDEMGFRAGFAEVDSANLAAILQVAVRTVAQTGTGGSALQTARAIARGIIGLPEIKAGFSGHCEVAQRLAERLGLGANIIYALGQLYERWDGKGAPFGVKGESIAPAVLVVTLAQDALIFHRLGGVDAAVAIARERQGATYAPKVAECFCAHASQLCAGIQDEPSWETVLAMEPGVRNPLDEAQLDAACQALADFVDIKSVYTLNHSSGVAALAADAAQRAGLPKSDMTAIRRAGLLHDLGRTGVSSTVWDKHGSLTDREWERVRLHPYYTQRILARPAGLASLGSIAAANHERMDGSGYHRGLPASMLSPVARILAVADVYHAMCEDRPHRATLDLDTAMAEVKRMVRDGKLDSDAANAVLAAAGHRIAPGRQTLPAGLTEREAEVLRHIARGLTIRQVAEKLVLSAKTVDSHLQHIYTKINVSTRAGATLFAMEHKLLNNDY